MCSRSLSVAVVERRERQTQYAGQIEVQSVVTLKLIALGQFDDLARGIDGEVSPDVETVEIRERQPQPRPAQDLAAMLAKQDVSHFDPPLHRDVQDSPVGGGGADRGGVVRALGCLLEESGKRNAGVEHQLDCHQRANLSPRASASAWPAVRLVLLRRSRRMFAAMRLPAARRFAGSILRATIPGSITFMAALTSRSVVTDSFYCTRSITKAMRCGARCSS